MDAIVGFFNAIAVWETQTAAWLNRTFGLHQLALWLNTTELRKWVNTLTAGNLYFLPVVQWVHIISVSIIAGSIMLISLRMMGLLQWSPPLATMARRLLPWAWGAIVVNITTGILMVVDRPTRALDAGSFPYKMLFIVFGTLLSVYFAITLRRDPNYWEKTGGHRTAARVLGLVSLLLWVGVILAGRWIFYSRLPNSLILPPRVL